MGQRVWGHLLAPARLKVQTLKSFASGQLPSVSTQGPAGKTPTAGRLSGILGAAFLFPTYRFIQKRQNVLSSTSVRDLGPRIPSILLDRTAEGLTSAPGVSKGHIPKGTCLTKWKYSRL